MRLFFSHFVWVISLVGMHSAFASQTIIGDQAVRSNVADYPSTCLLKITVSNWGDETVNGCSGTLISANQIATAGHCFGKDFSLNQSSIDITCGGIRQPRVSQVQLPKFWVQNPETGVSVPRVPNDVAIVTLSKNSAQPFIATAKSKEAFFNDDDSLKTGISCYLAGFGVNPRGGTGELYTASLKTMVLAFTSGAISLTEKDQGFMKTSAEHGDSGGSLICEDELHAKSLVGITVSIQYDERHRHLLLNYFAAPWLNEI
jgi:hypothetical protein